MYGIYGSPNDGTYVPDQPIVMGQAGATTLPAPPPVDSTLLPPKNNYLGNWYEQGSVQQFFSLGLVNTKAVYTLNADGTSRCRTPATTSAPTARSQHRRHRRRRSTTSTPGSTSASSSASRTTPTPGNYWILDYGTSTTQLVGGTETGRSSATRRGRSGFILTRDQTITDDEYQALLARARLLGVSGLILRTRQYPATAGGRPAGPGAGAGKRFGVVSKPASADLSTPNTPETLDGKAQTGQSVVQHVCVGS